MILVMTLISGGAIGYDEYDYDDDDDDGSGDAGFLMNYVDYYTL